MTPTPENRAGNLTERIMAAITAADSPVRGGIMEATRKYNWTYEQVYKALASEKDLAAIFPIADGEFCSECGKVR